MKYARLYLLILLCYLSVISRAQNALHVKLNQIAKGLTSPVGMAAPNDGSNRLFVIEQGGRIKIIKNNAVLPTPFIDLSPKLDALNIGYSEKGLLGLAFDPDYQKNGRFYVYYSAPTEQPGYDHQSIVAAYSVSSNPDVASTQEEIILRIPEPESNHNGGCLQFGKDGYLYIGVGDGGGAGDKHGKYGNGQSLNTLLGKILRIDVSGSQRPYSIPPDNPFVNMKDARPEIYAYGLRNPWHFSFDKSIGVLYCGDVGQDKWEEIDIIEKGKNYGWRIMEGKHCYSPQQNCDMQGLTLPITEYDHDEGVSICGGSMYRGRMFPSLHGYYFFSDWSGKMFYLRKDKSGQWIRGEVIAEGNKSNDMGSKINCMAEDVNGEVYILTQKLFGPKSPTGSVYRIEL